MSEGVKDNQEAVAAPDKQQELQNKELSNKELNFRKLEAAREQEREARLKAEAEIVAMRREMSEIKTFLTPKEKDPLDDVEDFVDKERLRAIREADRARFQKEAKEIARQTYMEAQQEYEKKNYLKRLKSEFPDFDQVMTADNLSSLEQSDPVFAETVLEIPDDYSRFAKAYKKLKSMKHSESAAKEKTLSIKEKVEENQRNPYYIPPSVATPASGAIDFDVRSKAAREKAFAELRANQRRPIL